ncbi:hypothetical protein FPV67DRAFT_1039255 [Lyophyllum atratum]|nr:hypothetical protein FPV67DRAFT_1039255 [Lyophyllum atratum]
MAFLPEPLLAVETWTEIISYLSYSDQVSLLHVSRKLHDIAIRFVFASVKLYFVGGQGFTEMFQSYPYFFMDMDNVAESMMRHSWEILEHITVNRGFATAVKTLSIIAYADSPSIFERLCLAKALLVMSDLNAFYWFGRQPELPCEVTDCLPLHLRSLSVQSIPPITQTNLSRLRSMQIQRLELETLFHLPPRMHSTDPDTSFWTLLVNPSTTPSTLEILLSPQLRRLSLLSRHIEGISMHEFASLTELELCVACDAYEPGLTGIDLIFHHLPALESLSIVGFLSSEIFLFLPHSPTSLPNLKSFRLSAETWSLPQVSEGEMSVLSQFLNSRSCLRRLSLRLGSANWDMIAILLPTIRSIRGLEVLGLHAGHDCMLIGDFEALASIITLQMSAIQLVIPWDYDSTVNVDSNALAPLLQRLQELPRLRFIHLYSIGRTLPIDPDDLVSDLIHLDTLGYNRCLWDVHDRTLTQWKPWRVQYAIEEDFHRKDDAWLFKYL